MSDKQDKIRICRNHDEYQVPLISTFAFNGSEYWCPYCGANEGMMGAGELVEHTLELSERDQAYQRLTRDDANGYLHAKGVQVCSGTEWEGKSIAPHELPQGEKDRLEGIRDAYKYDRKIEDIDIAKELETNKTISSKKQD